MYRLINMIYIYELVRQERNNVRNVWNLLLIRNTLYTQLLAKDLLENIITAGVVAVVEVLILIIVMVVIAVVIAISSI
jgi:hypothetical protein